MLARIDTDAHGSPTVWAQNLGEAYQGLGYVHGRHRPLQTLLLGCVARGELAQRLLPLGALAHTDAMIKRLDIPERGRRDAEQLDNHTRALLTSYIDGIRAGLRDAGPTVLRWLGTTLPPPEPATILAGLMVSAYLGLAQSQERMERALVDALAAGARPEVLEQLFGARLSGWRPDLLKEIPRTSGLGFAARPLFAQSGSNAWAVGGERTASGKPMLCGDPHLQVNQLPALFLEVRLRVGDDYWLGASIPGLPGIAVGRNRSLAWSGTFGCADNVDWFLERVRHGMLVRGDRRVSPVLREVRVGRRWASDVQRQYTVGDRGVLDADIEHDGLALATQWAAPERSHEALCAYMTLPSCPSAEAAERTLEKAHTLSLHFALADRGGDVRYTQAGRVPRRTPGWGGLAPGNVHDRWLGYYEGGDLPKERAAVVASANEARPGPGGVVLATLAQPHYRLRRITDQLRARTNHDVRSMQALQLDLYSLQAEGLLPLLRPHVFHPAAARALDAWDRRYTEDSPGAHAFELAYHGALRGLAAELGGDWWTHMLEHTELRVWWCAALDELLAKPSSWAGARGQRLRQGVVEATAQAPSPWGEVQRLHLRNLLLGGLPLPALNRGPYALPGSLATVRQGNIVAYDGHGIAVAPAYRMVCDLADDGLWTALPGGIDDAPSSSTYAAWLDGWLAGVYHRLDAPR